MTILNIKLMPDPVLRMKAEVVKLPNEEINNIFNDMADTMYNAPGIGLAAIKIGGSKRVDVNEINSKYDDPPVILQALDNIRFIYFILSNPSRIYDNDVSKYLCIRLVMTSDFPRCEHKWK